MSIAIDIAKEAVKVVMPPKPGATDAETYRWRLVIAGGGLVMAGVLASHIALACGFIGIFGFNGFASAADVTELKSEIVADRSEGVQREIMDTQQKFCDAELDKNKMAAGAQTRRLYQLKDKFRKLAAQEPDIPSCAELP